MKVAASRDEEYLRNETAGYIGRSQSSEREHQESSRTPKDYNEFVENAKANGIINPFLSCTFSLIRPSYCAETHHPLSSRQLPRLSQQDAALCETNA